MTAVTPDGVLKELQQLWVNLGKAEEHGVLRACAMTIIFAADEEEEPADIGETIVEVMHGHPSRAIVLRVRDGADEFLESRVLAQCWKPLGRRQQICCEEIEIRTSEGSLGDVPRLILGLIAPDLPVVLVCRSIAWFSALSFKPLMRIAGRIMLDSRRSRKPVETLQLIHGAHQQGLDVADLSWTAITEWRHHIAAAFDDPVNLQRVHAIRRVAITTPEGGPGPEALYLAAWLVRGIGIRAGIEFPGGGGGKPIQCIELSGEEFSLRFQCGGGSMVEIVTNGAVNNSSFVVPSDGELLGQELSITSIDTVYRDVLPKAIGLAGGGG